MNGTGPSGDHYWVVARDKPGLLVAMMRALAGNARMSFEGNLARCAFPATLTPSGAESGPLRRQEPLSKNGFVIVPLEAETIRPILDVILPDRHYLDDIYHIQIERLGKLQFGSYDNFDPGCIVCYAGVPTALLDQLLASGVIRSWEVAR